MVSKKKLATATAAAFGAAFASAYLTTEVQADVLEITWNGSASTSHPFAPGSNVKNLNMDQVGTGSRDFRQYNDDYGFDFVGRSMFCCQTTYGEFTAVIRASSGQVIDPATFITSSLCNIGAGTATTFTGTGSEFVAFRDLLGNVGWFKVDFTTAGPIIYSTGRYGSMGETLTVGDTSGGGCTNDIGDVNGDGEVDLLDVTPFVAVLTGGGAYVCEADINQDGVNDLLDVTPFVDLLTGG